MRGFSDDWSRGGRGAAPRRRGGPSGRGSRFGGPGPWAGGGWGHRGPRVRRGALRGLVLTSLEEGSAHGYDLMQRLEARSGGLWRPSPGSIYPLLQMLEDEGLVTSETREGRRTYELTESGRLEAAESRQRQGASFEAPHDEGVRQLREALVALGQAARQVARAGNEAQIGRSIEAVRQARKTIYELLAED